MKGKKQSSCRRALNWFLFPTILFSVHRTERYFNNSSSSSLLLLVCECYHWITFIYLLWALTLVHSLWRGVVVGLTHEKKSVKKLRTTFDSLFSHSSAALFFPSSSAIYQQQSNSNNNSQQAPPRSFRVVRLSFALTHPIVLKGAKEMNFNTINPDSMFIVVFITLRNAYTLDIFFFAASVSSLVGERFRFQEGSWTYTREEQNASLFSRILRRSEYPFARFGLDALSVKYWFFSSSSLSSLQSAGWNYSRKSQKSFSHFSFIFYQFHRHYTQRRHCWARQRRAGRRRDFETIKRNNKMSVGNCTSYFSHIFHHDRRAVTMGTFHWFLIWITFIVYSMFTIFDVTSTWNGRFDDDETMMNGNFKLFRKHNSLTIIIICVWNSYAIFLCACLLVVEYILKGLRSQSSWFRLLVVPKEK